MLQLYHKDLKMKKIIISAVLVSIFISLPLFPEDSEPDFRIIHLLNNLDLENEFDFSLLLNNTKDDLKILLNVSFARHGRPFKSRNLRDIFQNTKWFKVDPLYTDDMLTITDKLNVAKIYSILYLSSENETLFYKIKRVGQLRSQSYPAAGIRIILDNEKEVFLIDGKINDKKYIWKSNSDSTIIPVNHTASFDNYGVDGWFIYDGNFYFFIEEEVITREYNAVRIRRYLYCTLDYNHKTISDLNLLSAITDKF